MAGKAYAAGLGDYGGDKCGAGVALAGLPAVGEGRVIRGIINIVAAKVFLGS